MNASATSPSSRPTQRPLALKVLAVVVALLLILVLVVVFFPWDVLRGPINRYVSEKTGRKFEITRHLDVGIGLRGATVKFDGIEFANPSWARDPYLVKADRAEFDIRLWPLLAKKVMIPRLSLTSPVL
ncbi:MAG: AsmA family protein, partial [Variovorax sp.]|nr:AsmA family protein [Variovorax sp.]